MRGRIERGAGAGPPAYPPPRPPRPPFPEAKIFFPRKIGNKIFTGE